MQRIPLTILAALVVLFIAFRDKMSVLIVAIMCGLTTISIMAAIYTARARKGKTINTGRYLLLSLVVALAIAAGAYFGVMQVFKM